MNEEDTRSVSVTVDTDRFSEWTVDPGIFGKFNEHLRGAIYPGVFEDYVRNGSFEVWNRSGPEHMSGVVFPDVSEYDDVAYPWEPIERSGTATFDQRPGGVHGRRGDDDLDGGAEVPEEFVPDPPGVTEPRYQRIELDGDGGVGQRVALPDFRTDVYEVSISVRGDGVDECTVGLAAPEGGGPLAETTVPVTAEWERHEVSLSLDDRSPGRYLESRYGVYELTFTTDGEGALDLDWAMLVPDDAVEGTFNPTTIELLREFDVTNIRWPGGNFASQYRWRDGVGPRSERPVRPIVNWGGLESNYLGTNEWLRFCELADVEPYVTVPYWSATGPEEAAKWVEYCNGSTDTEMGALRAEHGYPEPWDVTWWGVGNEVWGHWQVGGTDAASYAEGYEEYHEAMRAVDPGIEIDASGIDPWFTTVHDGSYEEDRDDELPVWNEILFEEAGDTIEGIDVHRYTTGIQGSDDAAAEAREEWLEANDDDPVGYNEVLVNFPAVWDRQFGELRARAAEHGISDLRITAGEWNLVPAVGEDWPAASTGTMAHAAYAARTFQTFVRHGDAVRLGHWTDYTLYSHPGPDGVRPPHPGAYVQKAIADPMLDGDERWHRVDTAVENSPTRSHPKVGAWSAEADDVSLVDAVTIGTDDADGRLVTVLANGSLGRTIDVRVEYDGADDVDSASVTRFAGEDGDPFAVHERWDERDGFEVDEYQVSTPDDGATVTMPPASVVTLLADR